MEQNMKLRLKLIPLVVALALAGCTKQTAEELIAQAQVKVDNDQFSGAVLDLKNAIQLEPRNAQARFLLGKSYVEKGAATAAEKELSEAYDLGYEPNDVLPLLAKAYSQQFKNQQIIDLVNDAKNIDPLVETALLIYKSLAYFQLGQPAKARQAVRQANEISNESMYSKLGSAYVSLSNNLIGSSVEKVDQLLEQTPNFPEAILLKAQLAIMNKNFPEAVKYFEAYEELLPSLFQSKLFLANAYAKNNQFTEAEKLIDNLLKIAKSHPMVNQLKGFVRYQAKDYEGAKHFTQIAIQNGMDNKTNRVIAGISAFYTSNYEQVFQNLSPIENDFPSNHPIKKLLTIVKLKLGYNIESADQLSRIQDLTEKDIILLSAVSRQLVQSGNLEQAQTLLEKTKSITFTEPSTLTQKGFLRLSLDDVEGISDLEQALALDPDLEVAQIGLAASYIENELYDEAIELANDWINKEPESLKGYILAATALLGKNNINQAEDMYNRALTIDPSNPAANIYYADKAEAKNKISDAITYIEAILAKKPDYLIALEKYFVLQFQMGKVEEGLNVFETALNQKLGGEKLTLLYAQALFTAQRYQKTVDVLAKLVDADNYPDIYWIVYGDALLNLNDTKKALEVAKRWVETSPENRLANLRLITFYELEGDIPQARLAARDSVLKFKNQTKFTALLMYYNVLLGNLAEAKQGFNSLPAEAKESESVQGIEGMMLLETGNADAALPKLKRYYDLNPTEQNAIFVAKGFKLQGNLIQSINFLKEHIKQVGESQVVRVRIAELAIAENDFNEAKQQYSVILNADADNLRALNNMANISLEENNIDEALRYAERATKVNPNNALILDTYATTLLKSGSNEEALDTYSKALRIEPKATSIGIRYVEALLLSKQNQKAASILNSLKTDDPKIQMKINELRKGI
ncbi:XrtA/PEP-CTERM system TPR-repeat protein PrsT [Paraglaciecola sp.]|uniref:XrtA/PEP-CTERM system TPR-repeat protein PrsT n=1 Tax=Paraglaciecola sp. TaxID=1920173 RepID=UPI00273F77A2|nr:XrtA/PEP-CTERM system TPR-repeat protein PrsT [Paraglaciecola sp.]MDP5032387.1 PEP-CTERM system TPR-repeat protein PrsT [Paraglaciecola sp.]